MGYLLSKRIDNLITHLGEYDKVLDLERGFFAQCIEWGRDDVLFGGIFQARPNLFVSAAIAVSNGTAVPDDYLNFIRAKSTSSPTGKPLTYIQPEKLPSIKRTGLVQGTVNSPKIWINNLNGGGRKFYIWPDTVTCDLVYYQMPVKLYLDDQTLIDESTVDTMPTDSEPLIENAAWEYAIMQLIEMKNMGRLTELKSEAVSKLQERFFADVTQNLNPNLQMQ